MYLQVLAESQRKEFRKSFENVEYFCATSDVWSRSNISFIAVSVHYFEPNTFKLQTRFIACEHFAGRHTNDRVAKKLKSIFDRYGITNKVYFVTTDGGTEYVAAFKYYSDNYRSLHLSTASDEDFGRINDVTGDDDDSGANGSRSCSNKNGNENISDSESEADDDPDSIVRSISDADDDAEFGSNSNNANSEIFCIHKLPHQLLPNMNRIDCSSHKLEKLGRIDVEQAKGHDDYYDDCHDRVFAKLEKIWKLKDSRISAEMFHRITGKKLITPHRIRWLKTHEAVNVFDFF